MARIPGLLGAAMLIASCLNGQNISITVRHAASLESGSLAPGQLAQIQVSEYLTADASAIKVAIRSGNDERRVAALEADYYEVLFRVPPDLPAEGYADVWLVINGEATGAARATLRPTNFGVYSVWQTGGGPAKASNQQGTANSLSNPAAPGQYVTLWGTGLGAASNVSVVIDGIAVAPVYAGPSGSLPGVDQINFQVPASGVDQRCYVPVRVQGGDWTSNEVTLSVSSEAGQCKHPLNLAASALARLDRGGAIPLANASLSTEIVAYARDTSLQERASVDVSMASRYLIDFVSAPMQARTSPGCTEFNHPVSFVGSGSPADGGADAGPEMRLSGPGGVSIALPRYSGTYNTYITVSTNQPSGSFTATRFPAGIWTLGIPGGATIAPLQLPLSIPPLPRWLNRDNFAVVDRSGPLPIQWDTSSLIADDVITVSVSQLVGFPSSPYIYAYIESGFACTANALDGQLTISAEMMRRFPLVDATDHPQVKLELTRRPIVFGLQSADGTPGAGLWSTTRSDSRMIRLQ